MRPCAAFLSDTSRHHILLPFRNTAHHISIPTLPHGISFSSVASRDRGHLGGSSGSMTIVLCMLEWVIVFRILVGRSHLLNVGVWVTRGSRPTVLVVIVVGSVSVGCICSSGGSGCASEGLLTPFGNILVGPSLACFDAKYSRARERAFTRSRGRCRGRGDGRSRLPGCD